MANYDNIKPYSDMAHEAAQHGGPERFLKEIANANYEQGVLAEKSTEGTKMFVAGLISVGVWETGKYIYGQIKKGLDKRKAEAAKRAKEAEEAILRGNYKSNEEDQ